MQRWAVIGTGGMADTFVRDAHQHGRGGRFVAVYSRHAERGRAFAETHELEQVFDDLDALAASDAVDAVYIASPHRQHVDQALTMIAAGKPVLVEKPVAVNAADAERLYRAANQAGVLCQEAFWTRFSPAYQQILAEARDGRLGPLHQAHAHFGFRAPADPAHRLNNPDLAGGALLDIGLYPLILTLDLFGEPERILGATTTMATGVDASADLVLDYAGGERAQVSYSLSNAFPNTARISGEAGWVEIRPPFISPRTAHWSIQGAPVRRVDYPLLGQGYHYEFSTVNEALAAGRSECAEHSQADSLTLMRLLDRIRAEWGPRYDFELS